MPQLIHHSYFSGNKMEEKFSYKEFIELLRRVCLEMEASQGKLGKLDAAAGDGDLGVSVKLGFKAVREGLKSLINKDIGTTLTESGITFNRAGASTFGALLATAFICAGSKTKGLKEIGIEDIAVMIKAAAGGINERGKASLGERTMLDAIIPAQEAIEKCVAKDKTLKESLAIVAESAEKGAKLTAKMKAKHGRAGWLAERCRGVADAGAVAIAIMLRAASQYLKEKERKDGK